MNIRKILLASLIYPVVYPKEVLNAVTLPICLMICNWALAENVAAQNSFVIWFCYAFQFYAVAVYLTNCFLLVTKDEVPSFFQNQSVYLKCSLLLTGYTFFLFAVKYYFVMLGINLLSVSGAEDFAKLDLTVQLLTKILLFSLFFVIAHYIYTLEINFKAVLVRTKKHFLGIAMIVVIVELCKGAVSYLFSEATSVPIVLFASTLLLIVQGIEYIVIAFCYMAMFSKQSASE